MHSLGLKVSFQGILLYILYEHDNCIVLLFNIATSSRDKPHVLSSVKKVVWTSTSDPALLHDSPTPEASCRATCDKLPVFNPTTLLLHFCTSTTTPHKYTTNSYSNRLTQLHVTGTSPSTLHTNHTHNTSLTMDQAKEFLEMPREFVKDGRQFITRCSKRTSSLYPSLRSEK